MAEPVKLDMYREAKGSVKADLSEDELSNLIDKRICAMFGIGEDSLKDLNNDQEEIVMGTPSVLSAVRATAYVHC